MPTTSKGAIALIKDYEIPAFAGMTQPVVIPAQAGILYWRCNLEIAAFAGMTQPVVIPAQAGILYWRCNLEIAAFAGMTQVWE